MDTIQPILIDIFNGTRRRLGSGESEEIFIQLYRGLYNHLSEFPKSSLYVFLALAFCMDKSGWCFPAIETIAKSTGKNATTVSSSIEDLCKITINGYRIFLKASARDTDGRLASNRYLITPSPEEVKRFDGKTVIIDSEGNILGTEEEIKSGEINNRVVQTKTIEEKPGIARVGKGILAGKEPEEYDESYYTGLIDMYYKAKDEKISLIDDNQISLTPIRIVARTITKLYGEFVFNAAIVNKIISEAGSPARAIKILGEIKPSIKKDLESGKLQYLLVCVKNYRINPDSFKTKSKSNTTNKSNFVQYPNKIVPQDAAKVDDQIDISAKKAALALQYQRAKNMDDLAEMTRIENEFQQLKGKSNDTK